MDEPPETSSSSFTPLATIPLAKPHVLHPDACNPTMDLVALLLETDGAAAPPVWGKGKGKSPVTTKVALWRMSGSKVWEVDVDGRVLGLAWSRDGTYLSLLVLRFDVWPETQETAARGNRSTVEHLAVHTGEVVKALPTPVSLFTHIDADDWTRAGRSPRAGWWSMAWTEGAAEWPTPKPGSSLMLIDVLPRVTPVDPPKPAIINPFAIQAKTEVFKPGMHPALSSFPALLPSKPLVVPDVLVLSPRAAGPSVRLLTGTLPLVKDTPVPPPECTLALAQRADALERFLDVILRGINACEITFREAEKQTMIWREELEECGQQQDMTVEEVHGDLFRFLMAGRCGAAVNEWMGNRMTNRTVAKWESTLATAFSTVQKVVHQSITPAVERILLILTELASWASDISEVDLLLDPSAISRAVELARGMTMLVETMRLDAETEYAAADEWCKWLRYEMARSAGGADDVPPLPSHDLKLTWSFMKNGFVHSKFRQHFPHVPEAKDDVLAALPPQNTVAPDLDSVLRATLARLSSTGVDTSSPQPDTSVSTATESPRRGGRDATPEHEHDEHIPSSPDTMKSPTTHRADAPIVRVQELEPWSWANALLAECRSLLTTVRPRHPVDEPAPAIEKTGLQNVVSSRVIGDEEWVVAMRTRELLDILVLAPQSFRIATVSVPDNATLVQASFFDDLELAVVFQRGGERVLGTISVEALEQVLSVPMERSVGAAAADFDLFESLPLEVVELARSRVLGSTKVDASTEPWLLALNGRAGRRTGWVLTRAGAEVEVLDMDEAEEEEEEEVEGDVDMEDE